MKRPEREDRFNYVKREEIVILTMQCEKCRFRKENPMICEKFPERKPNNVLRCEGECPEFKAKE